MLHPCEKIYNLSSRPIYGDEKGICRITGKESEGLLFSKWVRKTFTDQAYLKPGTIISNQALFCFDESSKEVMRKVSRDKPQRFRTYSHIIYRGEWFCLTKADKKLIYDMIINGAEQVCLTDTGQKHILFKHRSGFWQLDEEYIQPDYELFKQLHTAMCTLVDAGFTQTSVITGDYISAFVLKNGFELWREQENFLKQYRGSKLFDFAAWMIFKTKQ